MDYLYAIYTDPEANINVIDVRESHGSDCVYSPLVQRYRTSDGPGGINGFWRFDSVTGIGPFNSFYAAVNLRDDSSVYEKDDSIEKRMDTAAGTVAYLLDPGNLGRTLAGNPYDPALYNIMLVVPTVYWSSVRVIPPESSGNLAAGAEYNVLYMSSKPEYRPPGHPEITGMKAYAHSASTVPGTVDFETAVYPYLGIGVYESYVTADADAVGAGLLVSQSGRAPAAGPDNDGFKAYADNLVPASKNRSRLQSDYQQWNYFQWTFYKMMCYAVMGSKNVETMVGAGFTGYAKTDSSAVTGSTDGIGFIGSADCTDNAAGSTYCEMGKTSAKLFIENGWGSLNEFVGDAFVKGDTSSTQRLHAGNYLGGENVLGERNQPDMGQPWADIFAKGAAHRVIAATSVQPATWDTPISADANSSAYSDSEYPGDIVNSRDSGVSSITVGGRWDNSHYAGLGFACAGYDISLANQFRGARLAYLMSEDALSDTPIR